MKSNNVLQDFFFHRGKIQWGTLWPYRKFRDMPYVLLFFSSVCSQDHHPVELIRHRETKWLEMTAHWEKTMARRYRKVRRYLAFSLNSDFSMLETLL